MIGAETALTRLRSGRSSKRRVQEVRALARSDSPAAADALIEALGDSDPSVLSEVAVALASLRDPATIKPLAGIVARWTAPALAEGRRAALQSLLAFRSPVAAVTLAREIVASPHALSAADGEALLGALQADASGTAAPLVTRALGELAGGTDDATAERAVALLGLLPDRAGVLLPMLRDRGSPAARRRAVISLASCSSTEVVDAIIAAVGDPAVEVRLAAVGALGQVGDPAAVGTLQSALNDDDSRVREAARAALAALGTAGIVAGMAGPAPSDTRGD
jgi:HEAT repeat protein